MNLVTPVVFPLQVIACLWSIVFSREVQICLLRSQRDTANSMPVQTLNKTVQDVLHRSSTSFELDVTSIWLDFGDIYFGKCTDDPCESKMDYCTVILAVASCETIFRVHQLLLPTETSPPILLVTEGVCPAVSTVALLPWTRNLTSVVSDVLSYLKWTNVLFISDGFMPHQQVLLLQTLSRLQIGVVHVQVEKDQGRSDDNSSGPLSNVAGILPPSVQSMVLCVGPGTSVNVMQEARQLGLLSAKFDWLLACSYGTEPASLLPHLSSQCRITLLRPVHGTSSTPTQHYETGCDQYDSEEVAQRRILSEISRYIPEISSLYNLSLADDLGNCSADTIGTDPGEFELRSYTSQNNGSFQRVGTWLHSHGGWQMDGPQDIFANRFKHFENRLLKIGTIQASPFVFRQTINNRIVYRGFCIDLLEVLASQLNFRYEIVESPDGKYGAPEENGRWNGMVGMVARGEADMGVGPYTITAVREKVIDFSVPYMEDGGGILTRKGHSNAASMTGLNTFEKTVWFTLLATVLATSLAFYLVVKFSPYSKIPPVEEKKGCWDVVSCALNICGSIMMQGMERHPRSLSARCLLGCWWVFAILIVSTYTATLTSVLTVDVQGDMVESLDDLVQSPVEPLVLTGSIWETMFKTAEEGVFSEVAERMHGMPEVTSEEEARQRVLTGGMALLHDINHLQYVYSQDCQRLHLAEKAFQSNGLGIIMPENAPCKDVINNLILRLQEGGFLDKWRSRWWPMTKCGPEAAASVSEAQQLGLSKIGGLLILYACVAALALLCFALTFCIQKLRLAGGEDKACFRLKNRRETEISSSPPIEF